MRQLSRFLLPLVCALSLHAQDPTGVLEGHLTDTTGGAIAGALATATHLNTRFSYTQVSSDSGYFRFPALPVGSYSLTVALARSHRTLPS